MNKIIIKNAKNITIFSKDEKSLQIESCDVLELHIELEKHECCIDVKRNLCVDFNTNIEVKNHDQEPKDQRDKFLGIQQTTHIAKDIEDYDIFDFVKYGGWYEVVAKYYKGLEAYLRGGIFINKLLSITIEEVQKDFSSPSNLSKKLVESTTNSFDFTHIIKKWYRHLYLVKAESNRKANGIILKYGTTKVKQNDVINKLYKKYVNGNAKFQNLWFLKECNEEYSVVSSEEDSLCEEEKKIGVFPVFTKIRKAEECGKKINKYETPVYTIEKIVPMYTRTEDGDIIVVRYCCRKDYFSEDDEFPTNIELFDKVCPPSGQEDEAYEYTIIKQGWIKV